jgi:hypothetical protein
VVKNITLTGAAQTAMLLLLINCLHVVSLRLVIQQILALYIYIYIYYDSGFLRPYALSFCVWFATSSRKVLSSCRRAKPSKKNFGEEYQTALYHTSENRSLYIRHRGISKVRRFLKNLMRYFETEGQGQWQTEMTIMMIYIMNPLKNKVSLHTLTL